MTIQQNAVEIDALNEAKQLISPKWICPFCNLKKMWTRFDHWFNEMHNYKMTIEMRDDDVKFGIIELTKKIVLFIISKMTNLKPFKSNDKLKWIWNLVTIELIAKEFLKMVWPLNRKRLEFQRTSSIY